MTIIVRSYKEMILPAELMAVTSLGDNGRTDGHGRVDPHDHEVVQKWTALYKTENICTIWLGR